jgi:hydroxymethylglutaryl-CoA lyase
VGEAIDEFARIVALRNGQPAYRHIQIGAGLATAFGCTISGTIKIEDVVACARALVEHGADELAVADTVGYGNPAQCRTIFREVMQVAGALPVAAHFHDTRGLGLANVDAALDVGVRRFDASLGGLGGCPYAPGASGNIVTDDLVFMLEAMGLRTGIDLAALLDAREYMESQLCGEATRGAIAQAGTPKGFVAASSAQ